MGSVPAHWIHRCVRHAVRVAVGYEGRVLVFDGGRGTRSTVSTELARRDARLFLTTVEQRGMARLAAMRHTEPNQLQLRHVGHGLELSVLNRLGSLGRWVIEDRQLPELLRLVREAEFAARPS